MRGRNTSVYTVAETFPMLPEKLSTDITSLNPESTAWPSSSKWFSPEMDRFRVRTFIKRQCVIMRAAYTAVAGWLRVTGRCTGSYVSGLDENLRLQDRVAQKLKALRHLHGALDLETIEARSVFDGDELKDLEADKKNRAKDIIEDS